MPVISVVTKLDELRLKHRTEIARRLGGGRDDGDTQNLSFWRFPSVGPDEFIILRCAHTELANRITRCEPAEQEELAYALCDLAQNYSKNGERLELEFEWVIKGQVKRLWLTYTHKARGGEKNYITYEIRVNLI